ncbi:pentatricopeptide repeat-containing protein [Blumeria hordei DH14]|nr:pentatricopeptide repeat-containing protein [Blumeria hordei DH14]
MHSPKSRDFNLKKRFTPEIREPVRYSYIESNDAAEEKQKENLVKTIVTNLNSSAKYKSYCIEARLQYHSFKKGLWKPDWHTIKNVLVRASPTHGPRIDRAARIIVSPASTKIFTSSVDHFIFDIAGVHDCTVELDSPETPLDYSRFIVSGSSTAIRDTLRSILKVDPYIKVIPIKPAPLCAEATVDRKKIRHVPSERRRPRIPAHMIPQPKIWTSISLLEYIQDLTVYDPASHLLRFLLPPSFASIQSKYSLVIMELIRKLLMDPESQRVFSRSAFHRAMNYYVRKNRIDFVRELFINMEFLNIPPTTETYNIMLTASAVTGDFHNFHFILHMMLKDGLTPNGKTWVAFIMLVPYRSVKHYLYEKMKQMGFLSHTRTLQHVAEQLIADDLEKSLLCDNQDHDEFIKTIDLKYGPKWLSIDVANRILAVLGKYCLVDRVFQFLEFMEGQSQHPDAWTINTLLHTCSLSPDPWALIVDLVSVKKFQALLQPDSETCRILFSLAWTSEKFNMAKVVWRYACLSASTPFTARKRVARILTETPSLTMELNSLKWINVAPIAILGIPGEQHPMEAYSHAVNENIDSKKLCQSNSRSSEEILKDNFKRTIDLDLQIFKEWKPTWPFGHMLWRAIQRDNELKASKELPSKNIIWLSNNLCSIPISGRGENRRKIIWH